MFLIAPFAIILFFYQKNEFWAGRRSRVLNALLSENQKSSDITIGITPLAGPSCDNAFFVFLTWAPNIGCVYLNNNTKMDRLIVSYATAFAESASHDVERFVPLNENTAYYLRESTSVLI